MVLAVLTRAGCIICFTWCEAWDQLNRCISNWNNKYNVFFLAWHGAVMETMVFLHVFLIWGNLKSCHKVAKLVLIRTDCIICLAWCDAWDQWNRCISNRNIKNPSLFFCRGMVRSLEPWFFYMFLRFQVTWSRLRKLRSSRRMAHA